MSVAILPMSAKYGWSDSVKGAVSRSVMRLVPQPADHNLTALCMHPVHACAVSIHVTKVNAPMSLVARA